MAYINECIDVNTSFKKSFKSMSCLHRIQQFPRNFAMLASPRLYLVILSNLCYQVVYCSSLLTIYRWPTKREFTGVSCVVLSASDTSPGPPHHQSPWPIMMASLATPSVKICGQFHKHLSRVTDGPANIKLHYQLIVGYHLMFSKCITLFWLHSQVTCIKCWCNWHQLSNSETFNTCWA